MLQKLSFIVNAAPDGVPQVVRLSQNENGRELEFVVKGIGELTIPSGSIVTLSGTKPDGVVYSSEGVLDLTAGVKAFFSETMQMTAVAGGWPAKIRIAKNEQTIATCRIMFVIDADPVAPGSVPSDSVIEGLVAEAQLFAETARKEAYGSPLVAATKSAMTDRDRVYVYTGSESGMTAGHWYYHNGTNWVSGGVYQSQGLNTDDTLTVPDMAADAKVTGDRVQGLAVSLSSARALADNLNIQVNGIEGVTPGLIDRVDDLDAAHTVTRGLVQGLDYQINGREGTAVDVAGDVAWSAGSAVNYNTGQLVTDASYSYADIPLLDYQTVYLTTNVARNSNYGLAFMTLDNTRKKGANNTGSSDTWTYELRFADDPAASLAGKLRVCCKTSAISGFHCFMGRDSSPGLVSRVDDIEQDVLGKQDALTFDSTPTQNSQNPVTSAGIKAAIDTVASDVSELKDDLSEADSAINSIVTNGYADIIQEINWQNGYVRANGTTTASTASQMALIPLKKGQTVIVGTRNANTGIISLTTQSTIAVGDTVTPLISTSSTDQFETYSYTASSDINVVICVRKSEYNARVKSDDLAWKFELSNKIDKDGLNQVKPDNIDGNEYTATEITQTITENNYWYATGSQTIASGGAKTGMDKAVFDISEMSGKIAFGFDSNADYGSGSFTVGLSSSASSPYTRITYFPKTEVQANDLFTVNGNVAIMDLDATKEKYPTSILLFINIPHNVWLLENRISSKKALGWLIVSGYVPSIVVAKDGSGDYTTISAAVAAAKNEDTIYVKDGEYKETVIINKYIHLVGQSKQGTVLYNDAGDYNNAPLLITQGSVCNMTIKSLAPASTSGLSDYAYAIHLDKNFASLAKYQKCEIYNCDIYSEVNDAIGAGTNYATEYDVHDCFLHVAHNPVKSGACGFKCHNGNSQTTGKVRLRNNIIITEDANGTSSYDILFHNGGISNTQPIEILLVGNVLRHYHNGITNIFVPSAYNYGNSVAEMNTLH